ncbi:VolA/Pla-1 family phospholipase [Agaribacter marinus]|uniref:Lipase n=1 Tax=Agaribacter marinus TaxID=1431249 RepID=A0AA37SUV5_9ALTE|nr:VolA/Pla-1 family phospholipase [Agaribacter marinus]GLR69612.1 lipase [Agaribacter marinus]
MRKLLLSTSILAAIGLVGCGGETIEDIRNDTPAQTPSSRIVFDPANGNLNIPNDLLMLPGDDGFFDFTLNIPVDDPSDFADPQNALNILDGWSTNAPFQININVPVGVSLDESTIAAGVKIYEATLGLDLNDPECAAVAIPSAGCKIGDELIFGQDFVATLADRDTINIVPLRPMKGGQGHMLVVTNALMDTARNPVLGSTTWDLVKQDISTHPLASPSQLQLQTLINAHINSLASVGLQREQISYAAAFTTQSTTNILATVKQLHIAPFATTQNPAALPAVVVGETSGNAMEQLGVVQQAAIDLAIEGAVATTPELAPLAPVVELSNFSSLTTCNGLLAAAGGQFTLATGQTFGAAADVGLNQLAQTISSTVLGQGAGALCAATVFDANISLPYYSAVPRADNPLAPLNEFWEAACDSGVVLQGAGSALATATPGPNDTFCQSVSLRDLRVNGVKVDPARNITKFNPVPMMKGSQQGLENLEVQVTVPNPVVASALGFNIEKPEAGWPVAILVHGITSRKEDMLSITGSLSLAGIATVAIDLPVHGSRGFDVNPLSPGKEITASRADGGTPLAFLNLSSLPTARDNVRQSVSDLLGLRLGLNALVDASGLDVVELNGSDVSLMGVSLGAITGGNFVAIANLPLSGPLAPLSGMFEIKAASLDAPGGGLATFLLQSPSFGPLITANILLGGSVEFQTFIASQFPDGPSDAELAQATTTFIANLTPEQSAVVNALLAQFTFAAQTVVDSGDPINYFGLLGQNTPVHMMTVVGDGGDNLPDQVIPVSTALPTSGQLPLAGIMNLQDVVSTIQSTEPVSGHVKFNSGAHASSINPASDPAVTLEMQLQVAGFLASGGRVIQVTNEGVVQN